MKEFSPYEGRIYQQLKELDLTEQSERIQAFIKACSKTLDNPVFGIKELPYMAQYKLLQRLYALKIDKKNKEVGYVNIFHRG